MIDILTPALGESVSEATIAKWNKKAGEAVKKNDILVELETDKVTLEVSAEADGVLSEILKPEGETVGVGDVLGKLDAGATASSAPAAAAPAAAPAPVAVSYTHLDVYKRQH